MLHEVFSECCVYLSVDSYRQVNTDRYMDKYKNKRDKKKFFHTYWIMNGHHVSFCFFGIKPHTYDVMLLSM